MNAKPVCRRSRRNSWFPFLLNPNELPGFGRYTPPAIVHSKISNPHTSLSIYIGARTTLLLDNLLTDDSVCSMVGGRGILATLKSNPVANKLELLRKPKNAT
jgi:hypothetical protein